MINTKGNTSWNALFRLAAYVASAALFLAITPFIIKQIGVGAYGLIGIGNSILNYMAIATVAITSIVGRNLVFAVERRNHEEANRQLSTSLWGLGLFFVILLIPVVPAVLWLEKLLVIPVPLQGQAKVMFACMVVSFAFVTLSIPFGASAFVRNRLDISSGLNLAKQVMTFGLIFLLFRYIQASLATYGYALIVASVVFALANVWVFLRLLPAVQVGWRWVKASLLKQILSFGGWITLNHIGSLLYLQTDLIVVNQLLGPEATGKFAAIALVSGQLRAVGGMISGLFDPNQTALAARGDLAGLIKYVVRSVRITTMLMALLVGLFCGFTREILQVWLGHEFAAATPIAIVLTFHLIINVGITPLFGAQLALGHVKIPGIVTLVMGLANIILGIILAGPAGYGIMGVAIAGCIVLTSKNMLFTPWYVGRLCRVSAWIFIREVCFGLAMGSVIFLISKSVSSALRPDSWLRLMTSLTLAGGLSALAMTPVMLGILRRK